MCILQDFEAVTPNLLARTIETVEGGGLVILLLKTMTSLKQLYAMTMVRPQTSRLSFICNVCDRMSMLVTVPPRMTQSLPGLTNDSSSLLALARTVCFWMTS